MLKLNEAPPTGAILSRLLFIAYATNRGCGIRLRPSAPSCFRDFPPTSTDLTNHRPQYLHLCEKCKFSMTPVQYQDPAAGAHSRTQRIHSVWYKIRFLWYIRTCRENWRGCFWDIEKGIYIAGITRTWPVSS